MFNSEFSIPIPTKPAAFPRMRIGNSELSISQIFSQTGPVLKSLGRVQMRCVSKEFLRISALVFGIALATSAQTPTPSPTKTLRPVPNFVTMTDQMLRAPRPENWLIHRGNYQAWGYSPLDQITKVNVKTLQLVWARAMEPGTNEATPLVYNGVMYIGNPGDVIQAIDATTGDLMWEYRHPLPPA